jgi:hypothetical protein
MKRLAWLLLLPLASGVLFGAAAPVILPAPPLPNGTVGLTYTATFSLSIGTVLASWSYSGTPPPGLIPPSGTGTSATLSGTPTAAGTYSFTVQAVIGGTTNAPTTVTQPYTITISLPTLSLTSGSLPGGVLGVAYSQGATATGGYGIGTYTFTLTSGSLPPGLLLNSFSGVIYGTPTTVGSYNFSLQVTSQFGTYQNTAVTASGAFSINISPPPLTITTSSLPAGTVGAAYSQALAVTGGTTPYTWRLTTGSLPGGLALAASGTISGTPTAAGTFTFQITVSDSEAQPASASAGFTIKINPAALAITTTTLPAGTVGTAYTTTTLAATGGTPPYTWSVASGSTLPSGLTLNASTGKLAGTPTAAGSFTFQVTVSDSQQVSATAGFTIKINPALVITTTSLPAGTAGTPYTATALAATGGTPPYTWSVASGSALPGGLSLSSAGVISGTPTASGSFTFQVTVSDSQQVSASAGFTIKINPAALVITTTSLPAGTVGTAYTATTLAATGGTPPYTWSFSGALPTGLTLSAAGSLTGTPTAAGTFNFTIQVVDAAKATATQSFTITITAALTITTATLPNGTVGTPYSQTLTAANVSGTLTWSVSTGLPTGLALSSAGSLSGTPTAPGTFTFTVTVTGGGQTATQTFTITIAAALTITTATLPNGTVGTPYSPPTLTAANVSGTLTWSVSTGLPTGLTLSSAGSLSGTPTAPGTFTFTVSVTDGIRTATQSFTITVGVPTGPPATFTGLPATATPATQPALGISIPTPYPLPITGQVTLTFAPDPPSPDGGEVQFTTGGRTVSFTVAASTTQVVFAGATPGVQTGTVSGTITLTLKLTAAGIDVTPSPAPSTTIVVPKSAPVINSGGVTVTGVTSSGFNIVVVGYATSRDMASATVTFTAASGVTLSSSSASVPLTTAFTNWYQNSLSTPYGSNFSLTMPFTITNGTSTNPLTSVSVQLTNSQGNSTTVSATY